MMKTTLQTMNYCADCQKQTLHVSIHSKARCNNVLHLILSIFTGGLWIIIWILAWMCCEDGTTDPACTICGSTDTRTWIPVARPSVASRWAVSPWLRLTLFLIVCGVIWAVIPHSHPTASPAPQTTAYVAATPEPEPEVRRAVRVMRGTDGRIMPMPPTNLNSGMETDYSTNLNSGM